MTLVFHGELETILQRMAKCSKAAARPAVQWKRPTHGSPNDANHRHYMTPHLPAHVSNLVWQYFTFFETLANDIIETSYARKQHCDKRATGTAILIVVFTIMTTMAEALSKSFSGFFQSSSSSISFAFSVFVILLAAASTTLSLFNRHYINKTSEINKTLEELNRHRNELIQWKRELVELPPTKYRKELDYLEDRLLRLANSVDSTMNKNVIHLPASLDISAIDNNDQRQNYLLSQYRECIQRICQRHGFRVSWEI